MEKFTVNYNEKEINLDFDNVQRFVLLTNLRTIITTAFAENDISSFIEFKNSEDKGDVKKMILATSKFAKVQSQVLREIVDWELEEEISEVVKSDNPDVEISDVEVLKIITQMDFLMNVGFSLVS